MPIRFAVVLALCCAFIVSAREDRPLTPMTAMPAVPRLVVIGDLHADLENSRRAFRLAGAIDERDAWIGGSLTVVQMGDLVGRGKEDRAVLEFVLALQDKARTAGGTLHVLLGNHEVFAARPDHRWVAPEAFEAFRSLPTLNLKQPRVTALPDAERARFAAMMPAGYYAKRLAALPAVLRIGDTVFAHGGVLPYWARYGLDRINAEVAGWLSGKMAEPRSTLGLDDGSEDDGVMWSRHFAVDWRDGCAWLDESLSILKARRMIVAHTVQPKITSRCQDRAWAVDVGISRYYGGDLEVLEIIDDHEIKVLR